MKQVLSIQRLKQIKVDRMNLSYQFEEAFGRPQNRGIWFVWGNSGSGKSSFVMQLAKELAREDKTFYNLLEESPDDDSFLQRIEMFEMDQVQKNFGVQNFNFEELNEYLDKKGSPKNVIIDSAKYFFQNFEQLLELEKKYCNKKHNKTFIITGHADGKNPRTELEKSIMFHAYMKLHVDAYAVHCKGRSIGRNGGHYIIWKEKYEELNGKSN